MKKRVNSAVSGIFGLFILGGCVSPQPIADPAPPQIASFKAGVMELGDGIAVVTPLIFEPIREYGDKIRFVVPASDAPEPAIYVDDFVEVWWDVAGGVRESYPPQITVTEWRRITLDDLTDEELSQMPREAEAAPNSSIQGDFAEEMNYSILVGEWENRNEDLFWDSEIGSPLILKSDGTGVISPRKSSPRSHPAPQYPDGLYVEWILNDNILTIDVPSQDRPQPIIRVVESDGDRIYLTQSENGTAVYERAAPHSLPHDRD